MNNQNNQKSNLTLSTTLPGPHPDGGRLWVQPGVGGKNES